MPRGDKSSYTDKQKRQAQHIEQSYVERGVSEDEAEARAWATVNKEGGGGKKSGAGRGNADKPDTSKPRSHEKKTRTAASNRTAAERSASANTAARTRARNARASS